MYNELKKTVKIQYKEEQIREKGFKKQQTQALKEKKLLKTFKVEDDVDVDIEEIKKPEKPIEISIDEEKQWKEARLAVISKEMRW